MPGGRGLSRPSFDLGTPADGGRRPRGRSPGAKRSPAQSWAAARVAAREGRRDEAFRLARAAIASGGPAEARRAARAALVLATSPTADVSAREAASGVLEAARERAPKVADLLVMSGILRHFQARYDEEAAFYQARPAQRPACPTRLQPEQPRPGSSPRIRPRITPRGLAIIDAPILKDGSPRPPDADRLGTRGVILMRLGRLPEAIRDLEESIKLSPVSLTSYYLALAFHKAGRSADSALALDSARKAGLSPTDIDSPQRAEYYALLAASRAER